MASCYIAYFPLVGGGTRVPAKLVDLDPQANKFAEVWGWRILVGEYFSADYVPTPFQYRWVKSTNGSDGDAEQGAAGQSILTNINWNETAEIAHSQILQKIRNATRLSIRFNMDAFNEVPYNPYFGWGRITGTAVFVFVALCKTFHNKSEINSRQIKLTK